MKKSTKKMLIIGAIILALAIGAWLLLRKKTALPAETQQQVQSFSTDTDAKALMDTFTTYVDEGTLRWLMPIAYSIYNSGGTSEYGFNPDYKIGGQLTKASAFFQAYAGSYALKNYNDKKTSISDNELNDKMYAKLYEIQKGKTVY